MSIKLPSGKTKGEVIRELYEKGLDTGTIVEKTGYKRNTVSTYICKFHREKRDVKPRKRGKGWNADGHACKTCQYRAAIEEPWNCDYIFLTAHSRKCDTGDCDKYKKGARIKLNEKNAFMSMQ